MRVKLFHSIGKDIQKLESEINEWIEINDPVIEEIKLACSISPGEHSYTDKTISEVLVLYESFSADEIN